MVFLETGMVSMGILTSSKVQEILSMETQMEFQEILILSKAILME
jgi:hypothetical protein